MKGSFFDFAEKSLVQDDHCQFFLYQILRGMKYVHSAQACQSFGQSPRAAAKGSVRASYCLFCWNGSET